MVMEVPKEPTPGETKLVLDSILETLRDVKSEMATKDFVSTKFVSFSDRVDRIENDMKKLSDDSARSTVELKTMITDRVNQVIADFDEEKQEINNRIDAILEEKRDLEKTKRGRTVAITLALIGAGLSLLVSLIQQAIINKLIP
jgi:hypothetical protein